MGKTLYVSDLDGTLLGADSLLSSATVAMLNRALAGGALFTVATARTPATVSDILRDVNVTLPSIVMTGAALWHKDSGLLTDTVGIPGDIAGRVLDIYRSNALPVFVYTFSEGAIRIYHSGPMSPVERAFMGERSHTRYKFFDIPPSGESDIPSPLPSAALFYAVQPTEKAFAVYEILRTCDGINPLFYHDIYGEELAVTEVFSRHATKAEAIGKMAVRLGADRIVAFGDNINDLPMMRRADLAVAVANALPEVKAEADIVIGPNTEDAVARFILDDMERLHECRTSGE